MPNVFCRANMGCQRAFYQADVGCPRTLALLHCKIFLALNLINNI